MQRIEEEERKIQTKTNIFISDCRLRPRDIETYNKLNNDHDDDDDDRTSSDLFGHSFYTNNNNNNNSKKFPR